MCLVLVEFVKLKHDHNFLCSLLGIYCTVNTVFLSLYFDSMLILSCLCNIFVIEHFILISYFETYHNFIYYMINITLMVQMQFISTCIVMLQVLNVILKPVTLLISKCLAYSPNLQI